MVTIIREIRTFKSQMQLFDCKDNSRNNLVHGKKLKNSI